MKFRKDFVTNSSSSSFICVAKINRTDDLINYFTEEYGKYGLRLLDEELTNGKHLKKNDSDYPYEEFVDYCRDNGIEIKDEDYYLLARFYSYTTEGDTNGEDAWLYDHIPEEFMDRMYQGDSD